jgi:hypothetical protein
VLTEIDMRLVDSQAPVVRRRAGTLATPNGAKNEVASEKIWGRDARAFVDAGLDANP